MTSITSLLSLSTPLGTSYPYPTSDFDILPPFPGSPLLPTPAPTPTPTSDFDLLLPLSDFPFLLPPPAPTPTHSSDFDLSPPSLGLRSSYDLPPLPPLPPLALIFHLPLLLSIPPTISRPYPHSHI